MSELKQELRLCNVCGDFQPVVEFEISDEVCRWCDVTIRDQDPEDDYAHCVTCDRLINMDKDFWTVKGDNTFCDRCEVY